ncbi:MAG: metallophosphoesterase family protein [Oscillospiraceae bacterium]|nr:metallophosphoesterase family protein [Oscillospiraceae bacterium]
MKGYALTTKTKKNIRVLRLFLISLIFVSIAASVAIIGCNYIGNRNFKETFYSVSSLKVNNKIRIIQISDLHNCSYGNDNDKMVDRVRKLKPDLIIYTGDIIDSKAEENDKAISLCKELSDVAPSYYIYGNNEVEKYYDIPLTQESLDKKFGFNDNNREPDKLLELTDNLTKKLEASGVKVLKNSSDTVTVGATNVDVYGVLTSNPSSFWLYAGESFDEYMYSNENNLKITAIHEPLVFEEYFPDSWGDLMLAGHNHGGTVKIPMLGPLYTHDGGFLPDRGGHYVDGRYEVQGRPLIISSGLENKNIMRINNQPEIVIVDINKF